MAHPSRAVAGHRLVEALGPAARLVLDPSPDAPPSSLRAAVAAWAARPPGATHHVVLQDDAAPAPGFLAAAEAAAAGLPEAALAFYASWTSWNGALTRLAVRCGRAWSETVPADTTPTVALLLPATAAGDFVRFASGAPASALPDNQAMAAFLRGRRLAAYVAAPNLVEHDDAPSLVGNAGHGPRRSACMLPSCRPQAEATGILRLSELAVIPYLVWGEPFGVGREAVTGRWALSPWRQAAADLDLDESRLWRPYQEARDCLPAGVRAIFGSERERLLTSLWIAAVLDGAAAARLPAGAASREVVRRADECLALGGLALCLPQADLQRCAPALGAFAARAAAAGTLAARP
jgi:hypothetical protein